MRGMIASAWTCQFGNSLTLLNTIEKGVVVVVRSAHSALAAVYCLVCQQHRSFKNCYSKVYMKNKDVWGRYSVAGKIVKAVALEEL